MSRHSSFFLALTCSFWFFIPVQTFAQNAEAETSSPVEVLYVVDTYVVVTFDVDPSTGIPTRVGTLAVAPFFPTAVPSLNDHFLYVLGTDKGVDEMWVYATDAKGTPQNPPIQIITFAPQIWNFQIDPNGTLAYAAQGTTNSQGEAVAGIRGFSVNPETGVLVEALALSAVYPPDGPCDPTFGGSFGLAGFNTSGDLLYDLWWCDNPDGFSAPYYVRQLNQKTGALGPDVSLTSGYGSFDEFGFVHITPTAVLGDDVSEFEGSIENSLYVFPPTGGTTAIFSCNYAMLEVCGDSVLQAVDPSGTYLFFPTLSNTTEVAKLDLEQNEIVEVGTSSMNAFPIFSPDGKLIYAGGGSDPYNIGIYLFDVATGAVTATDGEITVPGSLPPTTVPALRK
jgi:hypothetical protein